MNPRPAIADCPICGEAVEAHHSTLYGELRPRSRFLRFEVSSFTCSAGHAWQDFVNADTGELIDRVVTPPQDR